MFIYPGLVIQYNSKGGRQSNVPTKWKMYSVRYPKISGGLLERFESFVADEDCASGMVMIASGKKPLRTELRFPHAKTCLGLKTKEKTPNVIALFQITSLACRFTRVQGR
ncbi:hypothetical protein TNIN_61741 [Trichonephila inaurata madagascariensis]|uniref:Uncharacterized protein n=1 Tax=Trichonephila inaurata madagascariensis TaxID=2747483 RepID=A0A8X7C7L6_9ARAC|nr:hypothetical protein TNIN_61741 [Trichonephila inaurata madagascariensis]